jgi:SPP1 gp7 family putative phage head morphogenesis protein
VANPAVVSMATRQQVMLERLKAGNAKSLEPFLKDAADAIRKQLAKGELTELGRARLDSQLAAITSELGTIYSKAGEQIHLDLKDYADYAGGAEARALEAIVAPGLSIAAPTQAQIYTAAYGRPLGSGKYATMLRPLVDKWATGTVERAENILRLGYFQGKTNRQLTDELVGTARNRYLDGLVGGSYRSGEMVVRTSMQHMAMTARDAFIQANADIIGKVEWVSTLDARTTIQCQALDGQEFPLDAGPRPPLHIGCRSTIVPVLAKKYLSKALQQGATRSSIDGPVSAGQSYYDWLKTQPASFQDVALGPVRGQLFRDGGLTSERFAELQLHKDFTPATLEEIRRLEPVAFERAGL